MTRTPRLSDIQLVILATAAQRPDGNLLPPPDTLGDDGDRIRKAVPPLIKRLLVEEVSVTIAAQAWRIEGDRQLGVVITEAGRSIISVAQAEGSPSQITSEATNVTDAPSQVAVPTKSPTKIGQVVDLLQREQGATLAELVEVTGWLPHTTRAALTGLRKKGHAVARTSCDNISCYRIAAAA